MSANSTKQIHRHRVLVTGGAGFLGSHLCERLLADGNEVICLNLIEGMVRMMNQDGFIGPVNLGNPGEFTMLQLARLVIELVGGNSKIVFRPLPSDDPRQRQPDIRLARERLGWEPRVPLAEGLQHTIAYFRTVLPATEAG